MRLLHVSQPTTGGAAVVVRMLVQAALRHGVDVTVACPADGTLRSWVEEAGADWHHINLARSPVLADVQHTAHLRSLMSDFDVVHLHSSKAGAVGRMASSAIRGAPPIVFTPHGWSWYSSQRLAPAYKAFERLVAPQTAAWVTVSEEERAAGEAVLRTRGRLCVIENGVDVDRFRPSDGPRRDDVVVCVGRLSWEKGQDRLLRAVAALSDPTVEVRLIGDGPLRAELETLATTLGISGQIAFPGHVDPLPHLQEAALAVVPSRWEAMSLASLEALATGTPVITTDTGGASIIPGAGLVVPVDDEGSVEGLRAGMSQLLSDDVSRREMSDVGRARALARFSIERVWSEHLNLYDRLRRHST